MKSLSNGLIIDGFVRKPSVGSGASTPKIQKIPRGFSENSAKPGVRKLKSTAQNIHQRAQRSQTLMRGAVHKPAQAKKISLKTRGSADDSARISRAGAITKHSRVAHFDNSSIPEKARVAKPKSASRLKPARKSAPTYVSSSTSTKALARPVPSMVTSVSHQHLERLLDQAFIRADAHKKSREIPNKGIWQKIKSAPRWLSLGVSILIVALLAGFYAWHNIPQVAMQVAATRANVKASVPSYTPPGFSYSGPINYSSGNVTMKFTAESDSSRTFTLSQKQSNMTSKSLSAVAVPKNAEVQTSQVDGTTVYIYGSNNNATWVNHGIQYTIEDKANLNSDQLLKIAGSL